MLLREAQGVLRYYLFKPGELAPLEIEVAETFQLLAAERDWNEVLRLATCGFENNIDGRTLLEGIASIARAHLDECQELWPG